MSEAKSNFVLKRGKMIGMLVPHFIQIEKDAFNDREKVLILEDPKMFMKKNREKKRD